MQKARRQSFLTYINTLKYKPSTACRCKISGTISLPLLGYFSPFPHGTSSLSVTNKYLGLDDGPPRFPPDFSCPVVLRNSLRRYSISITGLSPSMVIFSKMIYLSNRGSCIFLKPYNPVRQVAQFSLYPVRSPLLGISLLISLPLGNEMFHFPKYAFYVYCFNTE